MEQGAQQTSEQHIKTEPKANISEASGPTVTRHCLTCGSLDGSISAFTRIGKGNANTEPLINILSFILKKSIIDIHLYSDVVCLKCFQKFNSLHKLQCKLVDVYRETIQTFNKALKYFLKAKDSLSYKERDDEGVLVLNSEELKVDENRIALRVLSLATAKKNEKKEEKPQRKYVCQVCNKSFRAYSHRVDHMLVHIKDKSFKCDICGFLSSTKSNLTKHKLQHTEECVCNICNKKLCNKFSLKDHMKIHNNDKQFKCEYCSKCFVRLRDKRIHEKVHSNTNDAAPHRCTVCRKRFALRSRLERHMLIHSKEKQFECQICNKKFVRKDDLKGHERVHTGEKPYSCSECGRLFRYISNCRNHMRIHMRDSNAYRCHCCNQSFPNESKYESHLKTRNHKKKSLMTGSDDYVYCSGCRTNLTPSDYALHKPTCGKQKPRGENTNDGFYCSISSMNVSNIEHFSEHTLHAHMEGTSLGQGAGGGNIISSVGIKSDASVVDHSAVQQVTVEGKGINMVMSVNMNPSPIQIPNIESMSSSTSGSTLLQAPVIDRSANPPVLCMDLEDKPSQLNSHNGVKGTVLTEVSDTSGSIPGEIVHPSLSDSPSTSTTVTILNPATVFKISDWDISQYCQKS